MVRAHVFVSGMVQMVFFRHETRVRAKSLGLTGWVKNLPDGRVEAVFEGPEDHVETMIEWCRRGPTHADVEHVEILKEEPEGLEAFDIRF